MVAVKINFVPIRLLAMAMQK